MIRTYHVLKSSLILGIISLALWAAWINHALAESPPRQLKSNAIVELEDISTSDKHIDKTITKIISFLKKSLNENFWKDDRQLIEKPKAEKVFQVESLAVLHMRKEILKKKVLKKISSRKKQHLPIISDETETVFEEVIDDLVLADRLLAETAVSKAKIFRDLDKRIDHQIEKAENALEKAYKHVSKRRPVLAIGKFKRAWKHALLALKFVTAEMAEEVAKEKISDLEEAVEVGSWEGIVEAATSIEKIGEPAASGLLAIITDHTKDEDLRKIANELIAEIGHKSAVEVLIHVLQDESETKFVRAEVAYTLGLLGDDEALEPLKEILNDDDVQLKSMSALGLGLLEDEEAVPKLITLLEDQNKTVRIRSGRALAQIGAQEAYNSFAELLHNDPSETVRELAALWLGNLRNPQALGVLIDSLEDENEVLACNAATALGMIKDDEAVNSLIDLLQREGLIKIYAARALAEIKNQAAQEPLNEAICNETNEWAKEELIKAYEELTGQKYQQ